MARVTVVGLGPAGPELLTAATVEAIAVPRHRFLRTSRHPAACALPDARSFDDLYEGAGALDEVYAGIVEELVACARADGDVLYAVPGSPVVAERSVELLCADGRVEVDVLPALSCLDLAWARLGVDPVAQGARIVDGRRFAIEAAGERAPLLVLQCDAPQVLSDIKLAVDDPPPGAVTLAYHLGLEDEALVQLAWSELDRTLEPDHLTSLWIPELPSPPAAPLVRFAELVRTLRDRCPWDRAQTHQSLGRHLIEESYELLEAIDNLGEGPDGGWQHLEEELGDLLFQVYFHATLAAEEGEFTLADVATGIHDKLVRRHPHVFGTVDATTADAVVTNWEQIKRQEKGRTSLMEGVPPALPALVYATKVQRKAASVGFDWPDAEGAWAKVDEELDELRAVVRMGVAGDDAALVDELGDVLFSWVNVARHLRVDPEAALRKATARFRARFMAVEALAAARGIDLLSADLGTLDRLWDEVKAGGAPDGTSGGVPR